MILDCRNGVRGVLVDENGQRIPLACWADTDTGEFEALRTADGKTPLRGLDGKPILYRGRRPALRFIAAQSAPPPPRPASAWIQRPVVRMLPISTTNITGLRI